MGWVIVDILSHSCGHAWLFPTLRIHQTYWISKQVEFVSRKQNLFIFVLRQAAFARHFRWPIKSSGPACIPRTGLNRGYQSPTPLGSSIMFNRLIARHEICLGMFTAAVTKQIEGNQKWLVTSLAHHSGIIINGKLKATWLNSMVIDADCCFAWGKPWYSNWAAKVEWTNGW